MAANEHTKIQVNYKLNDGTMINLYAGNQVELEEQLTVVQDLATLINSVGQSLAGVAALNGLNQKAAELRAAPPLAATGTASAAPTGSPTCKHGAMTFRSGTSAKTGKEWKAWMCPAPKGTPDQCPADFIR